MSVLPASAALALQGVGLVAVSVAVVRVLSFIFTYFLRPRASFARYRGTWAIVTGASGGIGAAFARRLAARGLHVMLLARSRDKLEAVADACRAAGVQAQAVVFDFANAGDSEYASLAETIAKLPGDVGVLVNNVGVNVEFPTEFVEMDRASIDRIVKVNIEATNRMTAIILPAMRAARRGMVFCLSSAGGAVVPGPLLSVYAGTKAYNDAFALALAGELARDGIAVQSLTPFFVESAMAKMRASLQVPSPDNFAESALAQARSSIRSNPYWVHAIMAAGLTSLPLSMQVEYITGLHRNIRTRALRKAARKAKQG